MPRMRSKASACLSVLLLFLTGCGGSGPDLVPISAPITTKSISISEPVPQGTSWQFPAINGVSGTASIGLTQLPLNGTTLTLTTTVTGSVSSLSTRPTPVTIESFAVTPSQTLTLAHYPAWQMAIPAGASLTAPYAIEVFDAANTANMLITYTGTTVGASLSFGPFGPSVMLQSGCTYIFDVVQNANITQMPH